MQIALLPLVVNKIVIHKNDTYVILFESCLITWPNIAEANPMNWTFLWHPGISNHLDFYIENGSVVSSYMLQTIWPHGMNLWCLLINSFCPLLSAGPLTGTNASWSWCRIWMILHVIRADSGLAPSQWETSLQSNGVSHWLGANLESALECIDIDFGSSSHSNDSWLGIIEIQYNSDSYI